MRSRRTLWVAMLMLSAFLLRLYIGRFAVSNGSVLFYGFDSYYHMRRIFYTLNHFPNTLWFDSYIDYPHGLELTWPPLFDILGAVVSFFGGSRYGVELLASLLPPLLGALTVGVVYLVAKELFDERVGLASAFLLAISPYAVTVSSIGYIDHHALEALLLSLIVLALLRSSRDLKWSLAAGLFMALLAYTWLGSASYLIIVLIYAIARMSLELKDGKIPSKDIFISLAFASLLVLPFWNRSWMMPSAIAIFAILGAVLFGHALSVIGHRRLPWYSLPGIMISSGLIVAVAVYLFKDSYTSVVYVQLLSRIRYMLGFEMSGLIEEASPLLSLSLASVLGLNVMLSIALLLLITKRYWHDDKKILFIIWTAVALILTFGQKRFLYILAINISILIAFLFGEVLRLLESRGLERRALFSITLVILLVMASPSLWRLGKLSNDPPEIEKDWLDALEWIRDNTPKTSFFDEPFKKPEYSIMSNWGYGNWIIYLAERPVVSNNFQAGITDSCRFFLSENERAAEGILQRRGVRYVITSWEMLYLTLPSTARWLGEDPSSYLRYESMGKYVSIQLTDRLRRTILARLQLYDGLNMSNLRLVYESETFLGEKPKSAKVKIFEHVPGAVVTGRSDGPVIALLNLTTNQGRRFQYAVETEAVNGVYLLRLPYSTSSNGGVRAEGDYIIMNPDTAKQLSISEMDVIEGRTIHLDL